MRIEVFAPPAAPDANVADVMVADVAVGIDAPMQPVAGEKIVEKFRPHQVALRHDLVHQCRLAPRLQF